MSIIIPTISVIIPLYNKGAVIKRTINSVLNQSFQDFEILVINDGSLDDSLDKVFEIEDNRLRVFTKTNSGVSDARNFGIEKAQSDLIFFLDADDFITADCLSIFIKLTKKYKEQSVFVSNFKQISQVSEKIFCYGKNECLINSPYRAIWTRRIFPRTGALLIRKECFNEVGNFRSDISKYEDLEFIMRLIRRYKVVYTPLVLFSYHTECNSLSKKVIPLNRELAYYAKLCDTHFFEGLILAEIVYSAYTQRIEINDLTSVKHLKQSYKKNYLLIFIAYYYRRILNLIRKIQSFNSN